MSRWQDQGVVRDSDDEIELGFDSDALSTAHTDSHDANASEDELALDANLPSRETAPSPSVRVTSPTSTASPDHANLRDPRHEPSIFDIPSSPLSDLPQSPPTPVEHQAAISVPRPRQEPVVIVDADPGLLEETEAAARGGRTFRKRNPIQLHPYLLEGEAYRRSLKARGLRPVNTVTHDDSVPDVQAQSFEEPSLDSNMQDRSSQEVYSSSLPQGPAFGDDVGMHAQDSFDSEEELPSMQELLRRDPSTPHGRGYTEHGFKRRKVSNNMSMRGQHANTDGSALPHIRSDRRSDAADGNKPANPSKRRPRKQKFRVPRGLSPTLLPTPLASSERSNRVRELNHVDSGSESEDWHDAVAEQATPSNNTAARDPIRHRPRTISISSQSSSSQEPIQLEEDHMRRVQKKIRGVLPASWLRLDKQALEQRTASLAKARQAATSPDKRLVTKGVARKVASSARPVNHRDDWSIQSPITVVQLSDDTEDEGDFAGKPPELSEDDESAHQHLVEELHFDVSPTASAQEDNAVDAMLPVASRPRLPARKNRKRQMKLIDSFERTSTVSKRASNADTPGLVHDQVPNRPRQRRAPRQKSKRPPRLSIVDAPRPSASFRMPDFVRIATRRARKLPDMGRHSPTRKRISMQTQQDGADVDEVLERWWLGHIEPLVPSEPTKPHSPSAMRLPLTEQSHNQQPSWPGGSKPRLTQLPRSKSGTKRTSLKQSRISEAFETTSREIITPPTADHERHADIRVVAKPAAKHPVRPKNRVQQRPTTVRPGQLENLQEEDDSHEPKAAFMRKLLSLNEQSPVARIHLDSSKVSTSNREPQGPERGLPARVPTPGGLQNNSDFEPKRPRIRRRLRKRGPKRVELEQLDIHRPFTHVDIPESDPSTSPRTAKEQFQSQTLEGLAPFGTSYPVDFGLTPLPVGVCFRECTLIGSGDLKEALSLRTKSVNQPSGSSNVFCGREVFEVGPWTDQIATNVQTIFTRILETLRSSVRRDQKIPDDTSTLSVVDVPDTLRSTMRAWSRNLSFIDPSDRQHCATKLTEHLQDLFSVVYETLQQSAPDSDNIPWARIISHGFIMSAQVLQISQHVDVSLAVKSEAISITVAFAEVSVGNTLYHSRRQLRQFYDRAYLQHAREHGIREVDDAIESLVISHHVLRSIKVPEASLWTLIAKNLRPNIQNVSGDIRPLEGAWHDIFTILPLLDLDVQGTLQYGSRQKAVVEDNESQRLIKDLLCSTFDMYLRFPHATTINAYVRTVLSRCHCLIRSWGFHRCESILGAIFDFFARRGLHLLRGEEGNGSPSFLERLNFELDPHLENGDRSFHIFLKALAVGLLKLRKMYPVTKMRNVVWRFVPNHGRTYRKDEELQRQDLEALRNHHDILCVLYFASPPSARPKSGLLQSLVDQSSSHAEVCRLGIRAWTNLARFQLSTEESEDSVGPFVDWFNRILGGLMSQHRQAEAEAQAFMDGNANSGISRTALESTINTNQMQVESVLEAALGSMRDVVIYASSHIASVALFEGSNISQLFPLFDDKQKRPHKTLVGAVEVYQAYFHRVKADLKRKSALQQEEDSQDYGDWPSDEESEATRKVNTNNHESCERAADELQQLLSNICGAETFRDDNLLAKLVDTFTFASSVLVKQKVRDWSYYLEERGRGSWKQLRDTEQTRKYHPLYAARIVLLGTVDLDSHFNSIMSTWLEAIVERESQLKFQHVLTSALLNSWRSNPILGNLPFIRNTDTDMYDIRAEEFRQCRLSVISTVLANIRTRCRENSWTRTSAHGDDIHDCVSLVRCVMSTMKRNYQETQQGSETRGSYVDFVQSVVQLLQQYTSDICPIDKFFTDSSAFPLPVSDPAYVVGKLKSYEANLHDSGMQKKLIVFLETTCERAAVDQHHEYLSEQLIRSLDDMRPPRDDTLQPELRQMLLEAVFPAYIDCALTTSSGSVVAQPILAALPAILTQTIHTLDLSRPSSLASAVHSLHVLLHAMARSATQADTAQNSPNGPGTSAIHNTLTRLLASASSTLPLLDYAHRRRATNTSAAAQSLRQLAAVASGTADARLSPLPPRPLVSPALADAAAFAERELRDGLERRWRRDGDVVFVTRGRERREVRVVDGRGDGEGVEEALEAFGRCLGEVPALAALVDPLGSLRGGSRRGYGDGHEPLKDAETGVFDVFV